MASEHSLAIPQPGRARSGWLVHRMGESGCGGECGELVVTDGSAIGAQAAGSLCERGVVWEV